MKKAHYLLLFMLLLSQLACKKTTDDEPTGVLKSFEFRALKAIPTKDLGFVIVCDDRISRLDENGQLVWNKSFPELNLNPAIDSLSGLCEMSDGRIVVSGIRKRDMTAIQSEGSVLMLLLNKDGSNGATSFFEIPELHSESASTVVQAIGSNDVAIIGNYKNKAGAPNLFCIKTKTNGTGFSLINNLIGDRGTPYFFIPNALVTNSSGDFLVAGSYEQNGMLHGMHVRLDNQGHLLSVRPESSETMSNFTAVVADNNSFVLMGKRNEGNNTEVNLNYAFSRIAPTGEALSYRYMGNAKQNHCIAGMKIEGGFAMLCFTNANESIVTDNKCYLSILKTDPEGVVVSEQAYGENYQTMPMAFQLHPDGSFSFLALKNAYTNSELLHTIYLHPKPNGKM